jgi:hypothetical protein
LFVVVELWVIVAQNVFPCELEFLVEIEIVVVVGIVVGEMGDGIEVPEIEFGVAGIEVGVIVPVIGDGIGEGGRLGGENVSGVNVGVLEFYGWEGVVVFGIVDVRESSGHAVLRWAEAVVKVGVVELVLKAVEAVTVGVIVRWVVVGELVAAVVALAGMGVLVV